MNVDLVVKDGKFALLRRQRSHALSALHARCAVSGVLASWIDYTVNGLIIGNIYALLAVGLALIFGVASLINFAHGSVYIVGAYVGFVARDHARHCRCRSRS